jgi:hypothetical protein
MPHQNTRQFSSMKTANKCPNSGRFMHLGKMVTTHNMSIKELRAD